MKESIVNDNLLKVIFSFLLIGGAVAVLNIYHAAKDVESSLEDVIEGYDGDIFV